MKKSKREDHKLSSFEKSYITSNKDWHITLDA